MSISFAIGSPFPENVLDLRDIRGADLSELKNIVLDFLDLIPSASVYRSIILAGSSALKTVDEIPKDGVDGVARNELVLWSRLQRVLAANLELVFGDYGVIHPDFSDQGPNKYMNAKIRYTNRGRIIYFRGHGLRHPVKDYDQYHQLAAQVRDSSHYCGRAYSYGDWYIDMVADFNKTHGSPGTWVFADMNHHFEYTAKQMPPLVKRVREVEDETDLGELSELT